MNGKLFILLLASVFFLFIPTAFAQLEEQPIEEPKSELPVSEIIETSLDKDVVVAKLAQLQAYIELTKAEIIRPTDAEFEKLHATKDMIETTVTYAVPADLVMKYTYDSTVPEFGDGIKGDGLVEVTWIDKNWTYTIKYGELQNDLKIKYNTVGPTWTVTTNPEYIDGKSEVPTIEQVYFFQFPIQTQIARIK